MPYEHVNAFRMKLKPGNEKEYKQRHDTLWPELRELLMQAGITEYYIFLDEATHTLFAFQKVTPPEKAISLPEQPIMRRWWDYMADLMEVNADNSPVVEACPEVFRL
jgi:L-rhamnose mutarotase